MERLYKLFNKDGIDSGWLYSLTFGSNTYYNMDTELLSTYYEEGVLIINSISINNNKFSIQLLRDIIYLVRSHNKVIFNTSVRLSDNIMKRYKMKRIGNEYFKGVV